MTLLGQKISAEEVACEKIELKYFDSAQEKSCLMNKKTSINSEDFTILPVTDEDGLVVELFFSENKKIKFLPVAVNERFPRLWDNFRFLTTLKELHLNGDQIERLSSDVFTDLTNLETLKLSECC